MDTSLAEGSVRGSRQREAHGTCIRGGPLDKRLWEGSTAFLLIHIVLAKVRQASMRNALFFFLQQGMSV